VNEIVQKFGPWALSFLVLGGMLKFLVTDKLKVIMHKLDLVDKHETELALIKQLMEFNGCGSSDPACRRRKGEQ